jgi:hypothetical protein
MATITSRDGKNNGQFSNSLPLLFLDNNVSRLLTKKGEAGADARVEKSRQQILKILNELGLTAEVEFLPTAASLVEYCGIKTRSLPRPLVGPFEKHQKVSERIETCLREARAFYAKQTILTRGEILRRLDLQMQYSVRTPLTTTIDLAFRSLATQKLFEAYLWEALALDYCFGLSDFGELPPGPRTIPTADREIKWTTRQLALTEAERQLIRLGLKTRRARPCAIARRIWTMAQIFIKPELRVELNGKLEPILDVLDLGGRDNLADLDYLDFAILGWADRPVVSITCDERAEAGTRAAVLWSIYRQLYGWWQSNGDDLSAFPVITPGKLVSVSGDGSYSVLELSDVNGEIGDDNILRIEWQSKAPVEQREPETCSKPTVA